jgi:hypothetical protein
MSFLDNLENNLKALEGREQGGLEDRARRDADRKQTLAAAPFAEQLKTGEFTKALMQQATRAGFQLRTKVNFTWIGTTLRLDGREQRLELRPTADGVMAVYLAGGNEVRREQVDLGGSPDDVLRTWVGMIGEQKRRDDEMAAAAAAALADEE